MMNYLYTTGVAIQLQSKNQKSKVIEDGEVLELDEVVMQTPYGIYYDTEHNCIWITERGYYFLTWNICLSGSEDIKEIAFTINNLMTQTGYTFYAPVVLSNHITGNTLLRVTRGNQCYQLVNSSKGKLQLGNTSTQLNLIIYRIL